MRFKVFLLLLTSLFLTPANASSDEAARGKELIQQAVDRTNIFESPSFRMNATVRIDNFGKPLNGTYSLLWNGPEQWREEITFPGYSEVRVGRKDTIYLRRSVSYVPYQIWQLRSTLGFGPRVDPGPWVWEKLKKVRDEKIEGQKASCIEIATEERYAREICIDQTSGLFNRTKQGFRDSEVSSAGSKLFPHTMSLIRKSTTEVEVHVTEFDTGKFPSTAPFEPPAGASSRAGCMISATPRSTKKAEPTYPYEEKISHNQGNVGVYALIDTSGVPRDLQVVLSASPGLDESSVNAIRKWRYEPATCNGKPVAVETVIDINYMLQQ